jgi:hypothetical protein
MPGLPTGHFHLDDPLHAASSSPYAENVQKYGRQRKISLGVLPAMPYIYE